MTVVKCRIVFLFACLMYCRADDLETHPAWQALARFECGDSASDRIIGGLNAGLGQFPWIVRLGYTTIDDPDPDWMCGGVLLSDRHVLTASHCLANLEIGYVLTYIRMGEYNTETDPDCELTVCALKVQDRKPKLTKKHPAFNKPAFHNDIAIIELDRPVELNEYVAPICLPSTAEQRAPLPMGALLTVAGWGKMNMTTEERAKILQYVTIPIVSPETCNMFGQAFKMAPSQICAGAQQNKDACGGDSGGPVMKVFDDVDGPKHYLVGVVSFGPTICGIRKPGVYVSVPFYLNWILDNLT